MLDSIYVDNFRLFRRLELTRLGRVNLIVGKNHSGKSTLLEAVRLFVSNANLEVLVDLVAARQQLRGGQGWNGREHAFRHLFYGHELPDFDRDGIRLGPVTDSDHQIHIRLAAYRRKLSEDGTVSHQPVDPYLPPDDPADVDVYLVVEKSSRTRRLVKLGEDPRSASSRHGLFGSFDDIAQPVLLVAAQGTNLDELAYHWDETSLTELEADVIAGLQLIEPGITGIAFIEDKESPDGNRRMPIVKQRGMKEPLPLKTMGDGILRLFHMVLALVNAQGGVLLVDEMENGIHWSVQPRVWDLVFQLAERLDVQVFATTHSKDCVRGFEAVWKEHPEQGAFFRLEVGDEGIVSTSYNCETLADSLEMAVEIR